MSLNRFLPWQFAMILSCLPAVCVAQVVEKVSVDISGVKGELLENVRAFLSIAALDPQTGLKGLIGKQNKTKEIFVPSLRRLHRQAPGEIRQALQPFGYYRPSIKSSLKEVNGTWQAIYQIDPGPPTRLSKVDIHVEGEGREEPLIKEAIASIELRQGDQLVHSQYTEAKQALLKASYNAGYLDAKYLRSEIRVYPERNQAEIFLIMDTDRRFYFGPVTIQQDILNPDLVERLIRFKPGEPFDPEELLKLQGALNESGYFRQVEVHPEREAAKDRRVPVLVETQPDKPRKYVFGPGFATDIGPFFTLGVELRRINRRGHRVVADTLFSDIKKNLFSQYRIPIGNVARDYFAFNAGVADEIIGDGESTNYTLGVSRTEDWRNRQRTLYLGFERDDDSVGGEVQRTVFLTPGVTVSRRYAEDIVSPRHGHSWSGLLEGAAEQLLSETSFLKGAGAARWVRSWSERGRFLFRSELGATAADDFTKIPLSKRFFAGGDQSVRGYAYQALAPKNPEGDVVGGQYLLTGSVETDYYFYRDYGGAVFFDAGNAFDDPENPDLSRGVGVGLRWRTLVGTLRTDFAYPLDDPDPGMRLHIAIGGEL